MTTPDQPTPTPSPTAPPQASPPTVESAKRAAKRKTPARTKPLAGNASSAANKSQRPRAATLEQATPERPFVPEVGAPEWSHICIHVCQAKCCQHVAWSIDEPEDEDDWDRLRRAVLHEGVSLFVEDDEWYLLINTRCSRLLHNFGCGVYETRPEICREYTAGECEYPDGLEWDIFVDSEAALERYRRRRRRKGRKAKLKATGTGPHAVGEQAAVAITPPPALTTDPGALPSLTPAAAARLSASLSYVLPPRAKTADERSDYARPQLPARLPARDCLQLTWDIEAPEGSSDWEELRWAALHENIEVVREDGWWHLIVKHGCSALTPEGTCALGDDRPESCKEFHFADGLDVERFVEENPDWVDDDDEEEEEDDD